MPIFHFHEAQYKKLHGGETIDHTYLYLYDTYMAIESVTYFENLTFYRFNHLIAHNERIDTVFSTYALNYSHQGTLEFQQ